MASVIIQVRARRPFIFQLFTSIFVRLPIYVASDVGTSKVIAPYRISILDRYWHTLDAEQLVVNALTNVL